MRHGARIRVTGVTGMNVSLGYGSFRNDRSSGAEAARALALIDQVIIATARQAKIIIHKSLRVVTSSGCEHPGRIPTVLTAMRRLCA